MCPCQKGAEVTSSVCQGLAFFCYCYIIEPLPKSCKRSCACCSYLCDCPVDDPEWFTCRGLCRSKRSLDNKHRKANEERKARDARCCANIRDEWREVARRRDVISSKTRPPMTPDQFMVARERRERLRVLGISNSRKSSIDNSAFLRLPPEIREQIYVHYMHALPTESSPGQTDSYSLPPYEPSLTRTCRPVRQESRPIFYKTWTFPIILHPKPRDLYHSGFDVVDWYDHLAPRNLNLIRHFEITICLKHPNMHLRSSGRPPRDNARLKMEIDSKKGSSISVVSDGCGPGSINGALGRLVQDIGLRLARLDFELAATGRLTSEMLNSLFIAPADFWEGWPPGTC